MGVEDGTGRHVVGGVDTHKDLHVAALVDEQDRVLGTRCFATTRQGYPTPAQASASNRTEWLGLANYKPGVQSWCDWKGSNLVCQAR